MRQTRSKRPSPLSARPRQVCGRSNDPGHEVQVDREKDADGDQENFRDLKIPNQRMNKGTHASDGTALSACKVGSR